MSLSRDIALHITDRAYLDSAFATLAKKWISRSFDEDSFVGWVRNTITRPLHKGGMAKDTLAELRKYARSAYRREKTGVVSSA